MTHLTDSLAALSRDDADLNQQVELILQQLENIPTLSAVALRLLQLTADKSAEVKEVVRLIEIDTSLSTRVLKLCRHHARGLPVNTVERAVKLLGFKAVRNSVLTVQIFEMVDSVRSPGGEKVPTNPVFDRAVYWQHSLAVALTAERLAKAAGLSREEASEAFLSGLLHDLGQMALHLVLPMTFDKVCHTAESEGRSLDQICASAMGIDTHLAGKRLAEHWSMPHALADVMWLHGQPYRNVPELPHKSLITIVSLADAFVRRHHLTTVGHGARRQDLSEMCRHVGVKPELLDELAATLFDEVAEQAADLGLSTAPGPQLLLEAMGRANASLFRATQSLHVSASAAERHTKILRAIADFHESNGPGMSIVHMLGSVVRSMRLVFRGEHFFMLFQARPDDSWQLMEFAHDGRVTKSQVIEPPSDGTTLQTLANDSQFSAQMMAMLPWLSSFLEGRVRLEHVWMLPLRCGWGVSSVLLHDGQRDAPREQIDALSRTWGAAVAAAAQHAGAKRLGERLAEANRDLVDAHEEVAKNRTLAALGEVAAGAAHEMNNPLTVISGRSQLLAQRLDAPDLRDMATQIADQSHRLSDMITALRSFAEPAVPRPAATDLGELLTHVVDDVCHGSRVARREHVQVVVDEGVGAAHVDARLLRDALGELLSNALEAEGTETIELRVQTDPFDGRIKVLVTDDGPGMSDHVLAHAFEPFFSAKPAGRQPGLGLARARRIVEAHGGHLRLENHPDGGARATVCLSGPRPGEERSQRDVA